LQSLAQEAGVPTDDGFVRQGLQLLEQMRTSGVVLGTAV